MNDVFVGRQPIYGRDLELFAYELLYRGGDVDFADFSEGDRATSQVLLNTFTEFGLERVVGRHAAFVNLTRGFLIGEYPLPVPQDKVVLEVLEDVVADPEVLVGLADLRRRGFRIALDDYELTAENEGLLAHADIVKVDVLDLGAEEIQKRVEQLSAYPVKLLAEKIETRDQFDVCRDAGFEYFQGYFLAKPNVVQGATLPASRLTLLRLLAELQDTACDFERVQEIVAQDVTLSYKLLRHINAAVYGMPRKIESIKETVVYLGQRTVRNLASLFLLASIDDTPEDLVRTSMMRAKMCEGLLKRSGAAREQLGAAFTVGLFSLLDALMRAPMPTVLGKLPLADEVKDALLAHAGDLGAALRSTVAYERGQWDAVDCFELSRSEIKASFLDAIEWADTIERDQGGQAA